MISNYSDNKNVLGDKKTKQSPLTEITLMTLCCHDAKGRK